MGTKAKTTIREKFKKVKKFFKENKISALTAIFLGIATLMVAWAGWISALHESNQAANYTKSNNLAAEGNAEYNVETQVYISDLFTWNTISTLQLDLAAAKQKGDLTEVKVIEAKIAKIKQDNCSQKLLEALKKMEAEGKSGSPFDDESYTSSYFEGAKKLLAESQQRLEAGDSDNLNSDSYQLASVLFSLVLFLLGIIGVLNEPQIRKGLLMFSIFVLCLAFIYMLTIPMPTDFNFLSFFHIK